MKRESKYAWFVVFCSFAINFIIDGVAYTFGIFFSELLDEFKIAKVSGAWVPSIMTGMTFIIGPVVSSLTNLYGCRLITITGTSLVSAGYFFSSFTSNISTLYFTIGIMAGSGFGLIYLPVTVIITQYFDKRLALATGLSVSAAGIGSAVIAPMSEYLIQKYGWRKAMQVISLFSFVSGLFAMSFKNFENGDTDTEYEEEVSETVCDGMAKQKTVKFNYKDDLNAEEEKLMKSDPDKLCNGNALIRQNRINFSQNSLNSLTSNEKHNRIINGHLSAKQNTDRNLELNEQDDQMLIPIDEQNTNEDHKENDFEFEKSDKKVNNDLNRTELESKQFKTIVCSDNLNSNLLANNLATSLNTNLNNVSRTNQIPRLSLDNSANYRLQHQLKQHQELLNKEDQTKPDQLTDNLITIDNSNLTDQNLDNSLSSQLNQSKSSSSLHHNLTANRTNPKRLNSNRNLNTIVLYSTSLTSINYCCGATNDLTKESGSSKHNSISNQKLNNVLTSTSNKEGVNIEKKHNQLFVKNDSDKSTFFAIKRRNTLRTILTVGKYINILLSWNLLHDRIFLWFAISNFLTSLGYYVPYFYIKQRCTLMPNMQNKSADCSYLLALIGFSSTLGRIVFGFLSDFKRFNRIYIYAHCLTICGFVTTLTIFANNYFLLAIYSVLFGLTSGAFVSLTTVIIVDLLGTELVSNAFGLLLLFQGVASLSGPPIVGLTFDYTSSYNLGFFLIGFTIIISGSMLYFVPCIRKKPKVDQYG